jgi:two-component system response regulator
MSSSILLIDDSPGECELFRRAMTQAGYQGRLEVTHDNLGALTQLGQPLQGGEPALILLDLKLQGERGTDVLKRLKADPCYAHIPVVILTTSDDSLDIRACYEAGANGYVVKPDRFDDLVTLSLHLWKFWVEHNCTLRMATPC